MPNGGATESLKFLELENFDSDTTVLTMPPDAADLPKGSVYKYEKFENLNSDLFKISATIDGTSAQPKPQNHKMSSNSRYGHKLNSSVKFIFQPPAQSKH